MSVRFVKSFSICCAATSLLALALAIALPADVEAAKKKKKTNRRPKS